MARCKFGSLVTVGVGKLGGHVFQRNPYGVSIRTGYSSDGRTFLYFPQIPELFQIARERWAAAPEPDKIEWGKLGERFPIPDWDGDNRYLTGKQFHDKKTIAAVQSGVMSIIDPFSYSNEIPTMHANFVYVNTSDSRLTVIDNGSLNPYTVSVFAKEGQFLPYETPTGSFYYLGVQNPAGLQAMLLYNELTKFFGTPLYSSSYIFKLIRTTPSGVSSSPFFIGGSVV